MSKITRRSYKRKKIIMGAALFGAVGLVSTGFAAWVLSAPAQKDAEASLHVGTVSDKNMEFSTLTIHNTDTDEECAVYSFEPVDGDLAGRVRFDGTNSEILSLTVKGTLSRVQNLGTIDALISLSASDQAKLNSAVEKHYIVAPEAYSTSGVSLWAKGTTAPTVNQLFTCSTEVDSVSGDQIMTFAYEVKFAWGTAFGGENPSVYFDEEPQFSSIKTGKPGDTLENLEAAGEDPTVAAYLQDLHDLLDSIQLKLTLTAMPD